MTTSNFDTAARLAKAFMVEDEGLPMFHIEGVRRSEESKDRWMQNFGLLTRGIEHALDTLDRERQPMTQPMVFGGERAVHDITFDELKSLPCSCKKCLEHKTMNGFAVEMQIMIACSVCGNKRCPKAADHRNRCTRSNAPDQVAELDALPKIEPLPDVMTAQELKERLRPENDGTLT